MAKRNMRDELLRAFRELNPHATDAMVRGVVDKIDPVNWAAALNDMRGQLSLLTRGRQALPPDQPRKEVKKASESPAKPRKEVKKPYTILLPPSMLEALTERANEDGASVSHHIRSAIAAYLKGSRK